MQGMHEHVRCITCMKGEPKVVVVGDNGAAQLAEPSQQLASCLSLSIWDLANPTAPSLHALSTNQQVCCMLFCASLHTLLFLVHCLPAHVCN